MTDNTQRKILVGLALAALGVILLRGRVAAGIKLQDLVIEPEVVEPGDLVTISVTVINTSDTTLTAEITLGGDFMAEKTVILGPGQSEPVSFHVTAEEPKTYIVKIDGLTGTFVCTGGADIRVENLVIEPPVCNVGDTVDITVTVTNYGTAVGSKTITCTVT